MCGIKSTSLGKKPVTQNKFIDYVMHYVMQFLRSNLTQKSVGTHPGASDPPTFPPHDDFLDTVL